MLVLATVISVADNGLAFTSVAEIGGPFWAGRAMGAQNTAQSSVRPPCRRPSVADRRRRLPGRVRGDRDFPG